MTKEIKYGGFSASPNDHENLEGDLHVAMNLIPEDNTIKPVLPPKKKIEQLSDGYTIMCIHDNHFADGKHYICWCVNHALYRMNEDGTFAYDGGMIHPFGDDVTVYSVEPVGNTLVVLASDGVHYILFDTSDTPGFYRYLGQKPPRIDITFGLSSKLVAYPGFSRNGTPLDPIYFQGEWLSPDKRSIPTYSDSKHMNNLLIPPKPLITNPDSGYQNVSEDWSGFDFSMENMAGDEDAIASDIKCMTDAALGAVNKLVDKEGTEKGLFVFPFFVRYAYELYDGSMVMHSYPVLLIPNSRGPLFAMDMRYGQDEQQPGFSLHWNSTTGTSRIEGFGRAYAFVSKLCYDAIFPDLDNWKDIIHKVHVYVSAPAYTVDQDGKVYGWQNMDDDGKWDSFYTIGKLEETNVEDAGGKWKKWPLTQVFREDTKRTVGDKTYRLFSAGYHSLGIDMPSWILKVPEPSEEKLRQRLLDAAIFYKIHSFTLDDLKGDHSTEPLSGVIELKEGELKSLLGRDTLDDDYFTRDTLMANTSFAYNNRINLAGVSRIQHKPLDAHVAWMKYQDGENADWDIAVKVKGQERTNTLTSGPGKNDTRMPLFVYYPDRSAQTAIVARDGVNFELKLKEHPLLFGAYWLGSLWHDEDVPTVYNFPADDAQPVSQLSSVFTSKVDNPFFFPRLGVNSIGTGEIMAVCAAVRPVSTGRTGYADLYIFADNGVWAADISKEGTYTNVNLITGDVCINADSITQMETTVLFNTARGIMLLSGRQAQCISQAIDDEGAFVPGMTGYIDQLAELNNLGVIDVQPFRAFLPDCRSVYDYKGQRIIVYNPHFPYAYIYSLESNKWGMMQSSIIYTVRAYPDALAVVSDDNISSLVNYSDTDYQQGDGSTLVNALLVTRPLTLDAPDILKTVSVVLQRGLFRKGMGHVSSALFGSRDLFDWKLVMTSTNYAMRGWRGTPYKWFRVAVLLRLPAGESISGCSIKFEPKYTNRLR